MADLWQEYRESGCYQKGRDVSRCEIACFCAWLHPSANSITSVSVACEVHNPKAYRRDYTSGWRTGGGGPARPCPDVVCSGGRKSFESPPHPDSSGHGRRGSPVSKTGVAGRPPWVRIPPPPWAHDLVLADDILPLFGVHCLNLELTSNYFCRDFAEIHIANASHIAHKRISFDRDP